MRARLASLLRRLATRLAGDATAGLTMHGEVRAADPRTLFRRGGPTMLDVASDRARGMR